MYRFRFSFQSPDTQHRRSTPHCDRNNCHHDVKYGIQCRKWARRCHRPKQKQFIVGVGATASLGESAGVGGREIRQGRFHEASGNHHWPARHVWSSWIDRYRNLDRSKLCGSVCNSVLHRFKPIKMQSKTWLSYLRLSPTLLETRRRKTTRNSTFGRDMYKQIAVLRII